MSGPTPMTLGRFKFRALGFGFTVVTRALETPWSEVDVCARFEALHWVGPKSESVSIKGAVFDESFGGQSSLDGLRRAAERGQPQTLATLDGTIHGRYAIQGIEEEMAHHTETGQPRKNSYTIKLKLKKDTGGGSLFAGLAALAGGSV